MHDENDNIHGIPESVLIEHTRSRPAGAVGKPFGWEHNRQQEEIRQELIAQGADPNDPRIIFAISKEQEKRNRGNLTFGQRQDLARWLGLRWVTGSSGKPAVMFTDEELEYIRDRLFGSNDPVGQEIIDKISQHFSWS